MLVTLHTTAAPDVSMLRDSAQYLLGILGKRIGERGVIAADELPAAICRLEAAISKDAALRSVSQDLSGHTEAIDRRPASLAQRAYPLLDMLRAAHEKNADILWGI